MCARFKTLMRFHFTGWLIRVLTPVICVVLIPYIIYIKIKQITKVLVAADVRCHSSDVVAPPIGVVAA